jgi:hypothetical protein
MGCSCSDSVLRRVEPERRVTVLIERVLDGIGPHGGVSERFLRPENLLTSVAASLQMERSAGRRRCDGRNRQAPSVDECKEDGEAESGRASGAF